MTATALAAVGSNANESGTLIISGTAVSASGTSVDFTGIPSWVKRITVVIDGLSSNGTSSFILQLGDSGGIEVADYSSTVAAVAGSSAGTAFTTGFGFIASPAAASIYTGQIILSLQSASSNMWGCTSTLTAGSTTLQIGGGGKTLSGTLTQVRITTAGGTNTFDAGTINILWE